MRNLKTRICLLLFVTFAGVLVGAQFTHAQTQRNPVLEFCTGTWCPWCPCGEHVARDVLAQNPDAIILAYHGAGSDPFRGFPGSTIISALALPGYPTGVVDRTTGIVNYWDGWIPSMNNRKSVPATVKIELVRQSYDASLRALSMTIAFTALETLSGQFNYNVMLTEDGVVFAQASRDECTPGQSYLPDYVHDWIVRDMIHGDLGTELVNGTWNKDEVITRSINHTVATPGSSSPDIVPDSCKIVVLVNRAGSPLNSNGEIQQARQWHLMDVTSVETPTQVATSFELKASYPNPFNPETRIGYIIPAMGTARTVSLFIYNQLGQKVLELVNTVQPSGSYEVTWDGRDDGGKLSPSGVYFYKLQYGPYQKTRKVILLR